MTDDEPLALLLVTEENERLRAELAAASQRAKISERTLEALGSDYDVALAGLRSKHKLLISDQARAIKAEQQRDGARRDLAEAVEALRDYIADDCDNAWGAHIRELVARFDAQGGGK